MPRGVANAGFAVRFSFASVFFDCVSRDSELKYRKRIEIWKRKSETTFDSQISAFVIIFSLLSLTEIIMLEAAAWSFSAVVVLT